MSHSATRFVTTHASIPLLFLALIAGCGGDSTTTEPEAGSLLVDVTTTGDTTDLDGYEISVEGLGTRSVSPDGSTRFSDLAESDRQVRLTGTQRNCSLTGQNPRVVSVVAGKTATTTFNISCRAAFLNRIVFSKEEGNHDFSIYSMKPDGSAVTRVTSRSTSDFEVDVSPNGTHLAFVSHRDGNHEIYAHSIGQASATRLTFDDGSDRYPAWSPSGDQIAFASTRNGDHHDIYLVNRNGQNLTRLTTSSGDDDQPSWSVDGEILFFTSDRDGDYDIYRIRSDGTGLRQLTDNDVRDDSPMMSPDGTRIAASDDFDIVSMNPDGTDINRLTDHSDWDGWPDWSPNGNRIVFASLRTGSWEIYRMDSDGGNLIRLTTDDFKNDLDPSWSPRRSNDDGE